MGPPEPGDAATDEFVPEAAIDYGEIFRRGGQNSGDEDFALFRCPFCRRIYLAEYEVDCVYLDPQDLDVRLGGDVFGGFDCVECGRPFPTARLWLGDGAIPAFRVSWAELADSDWAFAAQRPPEP